MKAIKNKGYSVFKTENGAAKEREYTFNPEELNELVTKREGYEAFSISLNLMEMSHFLLTKLDRRDSRRYTPKRRLKSRRKKKGRFGSSSPRKMSSRKNLKGRSGSFKEYLDGYLGGKREIGEAIQNVFNILFISNEEFKIKIDPSKLRAYILSYSLFKVKDIQVRDDQKNLLDGYMPMKSFGKINKKLVYNFN